MRKRTVVLLLAMVLSSSIAGCGNSEEPKQEESAEVEQEETKEADQDATTQEFSNNDIVIKVEDTTSKYLLNEFEYEDAEGTIAPDADVPVYCEDGYQIGYIKAGATIEITEHGLNSAWYRFPNPINGTSYDYIFVGNMDIDMSNIYCESYAGTYVSEEQPVESETQQSESYDPQASYENSISVLDELITDSEKIYTQEEFEELVTQIFDKMDDINYNSDLSDYDQETTISFHLLGVEVKDFFAKFFYTLYGAYGGCDQIKFEIVETDGYEIEVNIKYSFWD